MATKITVNRVNLIKALEAKQAEVKKAEEAEEEEALKTSKELSAVIAKAIEEDFANVPTGGYNRHGGGHLKASVIGYANTFLISLGKPQIVTPPARPKRKDMSGELAILKMSADETLVLDDTSDYFSFLKA